MAQFIVRNLEDDVKARLKRAERRADIRQLACPLPHLGHKRRIERALATSAVHPGADISLRRTK